MIWLLLACGTPAQDVVEDLHSDNPTVREEAAVRARSSGGEDVTEALVAVLSDPSESVRARAVESLAEMDAKAAVPRLLAHLEHEPSPKVQRIIVEALGRLGDRDAVPALVAYVEARLERPPLDAIWALGALADDRAVDLLTRLCEHADPYVRYNATRALAQRP